MGDIPTPPAHVPFGQAANPDTMPDDEIFARFVGICKDILKLRHNPAMSSMEQVIREGMNYDAKQIVMAHASPSLATMLRRDFSYYLANSFWSPFTKQIEPAVHAMSQNFSPQDRVEFRQKFRPLQLCAVLRMNTETYEQFWKSYAPASIAKCAQRDEADVFLAQIRHLQYPKLVDLIALQNGWAREKAEQEIEAYITRWNVGIAPELEGVQWVRRPQQWEIREPAPVHAR